MNCIGLSRTPANVELLCNVGLRSHVGEGCTLHVSIEPEHNRTEGSQRCDSTDVVFRMADSRFRIGAMSGPVHLEHGVCTPPGLLAVLTLALLLILLLAAVCLSLQNALIIGADYYESEDQRAKVLADGGVPLGIGAGSTIKNCIVDKNARIGKNVVIENKGGVEVRMYSFVMILKDM
jgi:hypothetical protein